MSAPGGADGNSRVKSAAKKVKRKVKTPLSLSALRDSTADGETRRTAVSILEVLAGERSPRESSEALGISLPRYYALEARALAGLIDALRKRPRGPRRRPEREIERLEREVARLERECVRTQSLLRVAQRAVGLSATRKEPAKRKDAKSSPKGRRRKKPTRRALRAVEFLKSEPAGEKTVDRGGKEVDNAAQEM